LIKKKKRKEKVTMKGGLDGEEFAALAASKLKIKSLLESA